MAAGAVLVSFAGSYAEAVAYGIMHNVSAPRSKARAGDDSGLPMLSLRYKNAAQLGEARTRFVELGWPREFHCVTRYGGQGPVQ